MIACQVCGQLFGQISTAHVRSHGIESLQAYKAQFPGALVMDPVVAAAIAEKRKGQKPSEETRAKLCAARVGKTPAKGKVWTNEERARMSESCKRVVKTEEWNRKNSEAQRGKVIPDDVRAKMSKAALVRISRGGDNLKADSAQARLREVKQTDAYKRNHAEGQARSYKQGHFNGLNMRVATALAALGVEFEMEFLIPGNAPYRYDFCFSGTKVLLEVQGCRWHFCEHCDVSAGLSQAARSKRARIDKAKRTYAENRGWTVLLAWEHELVGTENAAFSTSARILAGNAQILAYLKTHVLPKLVGTIGA